MAVGGPGEGIRRLADKGAGNDPAHTVLAGQHLPGDLAVAVELGHRHQPLVGCHLEDAVGAGVDDEGILSHGLLAVILQHLGAGIGLVAQDLVAGLFLKGMDQLVGEPIGEGGQGLGAHHACNLPVADGGILTHALLLQAGKGSGGGSSFLPCRDAVDVEQPQVFQVGAAEIGVPGNRGQGVGALVPKGRRIRLCADAEAVQHDQKHSLCHKITLHFLF